MDAGSACQVQTPAPGNGGAGGGGGAPPKATAGQCEPEDVSCLDGPESEQGAVQPYEVGTYSDLKGRSVVGDGLDIHHVPQGRPASDAIPGYNYQNGPAIALPAEEHALIPNLKGPYSGSASDLLNQGIENLQTYTNAPDSSIQALQDLNGEMFPDAFGFDF